MKYFSTSMLFLICLNAHADCQDEWLTFDSPKQQLSVVYSKGCYEGDLIISSATKGPDWPDKSEHSITAAFNDECPFTKKDKNGEVIEFSCRT